jgi:hypothetical protein
LIAVALQNCSVILKVEPGLSDETRPESSCDGNETIDIKVEEVLDTREVEDPLLITLPGIKSEREVSCMSARLLLGIFHRYPE